jgi:hypothetical protein
MDQHRYYLILEEQKKEARRSRNRFIALTLLILLMGMIEHGSLDRFL